MENVVAGTHSLTFHNVSPEVAKALLEAHGAAEQNTNAEKVYNESQTKKGKRKGPELTTEDEEDEDDASAKRTKKKAQRATEDGESEEEETEDENEEEDEGEESEDESEEEEDEEEEKVSFSQVKKVIDLYGEKKPKAMKALLAGFNIKSTAELKDTKKKWAPVHRKILATFAKRSK